ncbi:MAG: peptidylprolyl isomerase [archaeon]|nr:peptidylprolyl isomerase [archaeon]
MSEYKDMTIFILGRMDCPRLTHVKTLISDLTESVQDLPKFEFKLEFETQFVIEMEKLLKEDMGFLKYQKSPIIYFVKGSSQKKNIIGSLEEFQTYCIETFNYYDKRKTEEFVEETKQTVKEFLQTNGNKYVFFDFKVEKPESEENKEKEDSKYERVIIELFNNKCPITTKNFLSICKGENNEKGEMLSYENTIIHRVSPNSFIQGGDLPANEGGRSIYGKNFNDEHYDVKHNSHGILGMVKKGMSPHTNECQFYITLAPLICFDGKFVAFGRVIQGYETIRKIGILKTDLQRPIDRVIVSKCGEFDIDLVEV